MGGKRGFSMEIDMVIQEFGFDCKIRKLSPNTIDTNLNLKRNNESSVYR